MEWSLGDAALAIMNNNQHALHGRVSVCFVKVVRVPLGSAVGRERQVDVCELEGSLVYTANSTPNL